MEFIMKGSLTQGSSDARVVSLSLPKGGGSIQGMGETLNNAGPDGMVSLSLPLPISAGRGFSPALELSYSSGAGNGSFGLGWQCGTMSIRLRTAHGVPKYDGLDTFIGPDGEVLLPALKSNGTADVRQASDLMGIALGQTYTVTRYQPRVESSFAKIECWAPATSAAAVFWMVHTPDGQVHCLGKNATARIAAHAAPQHVAEWLLEESVSPTGEHIYYQYQAEDDAGCDANEKSLHPAMSAQRYLSKIFYGNIQPQASLFILDAALPAESAWLFTLVFDHGEREAVLTKAPAFTTTATWPMRTDSFSRYDYGFELRTRRLCRQVLMFHRLKALAGGMTIGEIPALVRKVAFSYDLTGAIATLVAVRESAFETDGTVKALPPLEFDYAAFSPATTWLNMPVLADFNAQQRYQWVDLYGEGLPGILYQDSKGWWYREPLRQAGDDINAVTYAPPARLPNLPTLRENAVLMDINGDGRLEWLVTHAGVQGYYSIKSDRTWSAFTPLKTFPIEYQHPQAQLADLTGDGLSDLTLIGPKSVRLYTNDRSGWSAGANVTQSENITLPGAGSDARQMLAFSDILGSGQQHWISISATRVTCWPNLGQGHFGQPLTLTGFSLPNETFNPDYLYLADTDGTGTDDIIYVQSSAVLIFLNQSGNKFADPITIPLPQGVHFDDTCQLQVADIQGTGTISLLLTVPHMQPQHWCCPLTDSKPGLMQTVNNNMGANHQLYYRSSAQFWLDEKARFENGKISFSHLPLPMNLLWKNVLTDEITGNKIASEIRYYHGAWDSKEREFRGFAKLEQTDTDELSTSTAQERTAPSSTHSWFATGITEVDSQLAAEYWQGDTHAFPGFSHRFCRFDATQHQDVTYTNPTDDEHYWLNRALRGKPLRSELYGLDGSAQQPVPYSVSESRYQVRLIKSNTLDTPVALASEIESRDYHYERIAQDPQCSQSVQLALDDYGAVLNSVSINYPRRAKPATSPYPATLPATLFTSSYDDQQQQLRLTQQQASWHHLTEGENWRLSLPNQQRSNLFTYSASQLPVIGLSLESLQAANSLISNSKPCVFGGQQQVWYTTGKAHTPLAVPTVQSLVAFTDTAILDDTSISAYNGVLSTTEINGKLQASGYISSARLFNRGTENTVWCVHQGMTDYGTAAQFWRPQTQWNTDLIGKTQISWDTHFCVPTKTIDAAGFVTLASYDYRFLTPNRLTDLNDNQHSADIDALARVTSLRFWGTEAGVAAGYSTPETKPFTQPASIDAALALGRGIPVAQCLVTAPESWMLPLSASLLNAQMKDNSQLWQSLLAASAITEDERICTLGYQRWTRSHTVPAALQTLLNSSTRQPPHSLIITTDRYDSDPAQQLRQQVAFSDGFGRALQTAIRHESGMAWQRTSSGSVVVANGVPAEATSDNRWVVSGRSEYDNKGQVIRSYQPYFLNDWRYVSDDSARSDLYADSHFYDPLSREHRVITAKGYLREKHYFPWFVVNEDENDTAAG